jgi:uroporphyrinogen decarboxylase
VEPLFRTDADLTRLRPVNAGQSFDYVGESIHELCRELHPSTAVIGFAGAPFTLAAYLVEGGPARSVFELKRLAYRQPDLYAELARRIAEVVGDLLSLQLEAGTDAVQLFDTWASHLSPEDFAELSAPYISQVFARLPDTTAPKILYLRNAAGHLEEASRLGCTVLSVDGSLRLEEARRRLPASLALQGNFDPAELTAGPDRIRRRVRSAVAAMREAGAGYVVNLGQGLTPETPPEGVGAFVEAVRECAE